MGYSVSTDKKSSVLILGKRYSKGKSASTGGVTRLYEIFVESLEKSQCRNNKFIDLNYRNYGTRLKTYFSIASDMYKYSYSCSHTMLHCTANELIFYGLIAMLLYWHRNVTYSIRKFAGNYHLVYEHSNIITRFIIRNILKRSSINYFETKYLVEYFAKYNKNTRWFPNVREAVDPEIFKKRHASSKYVFIGNVMREKGIDLITDAFMKIGSKSAIDIYGPIRDDKYCKQYFDKYDNVSYMGTLNPGLVQQSLGEYDALILPTYWKGEGYPGVIIEAFSIGLPVIATRLPGISELVNHKQNGMLTEIKDVESLVKAIEYLNEENLQRMSANALLSFNEFDNQIIMSTILKDIPALC